MFGASFWSTVYSATNSKRSLQILLSISHSWVMDLISQMSTNLEMSHLSFETFDFVPGSFSSPFHFLRPWVQSTCPASQPAKPESFQARRVVGYPVIQPSSCPAKPSQHRQPSHPRAWPSKQRLLVLSNSKNYITGFIVWRNNCGIRLQLLPIIHYLPFS